VLLRDSHMVTGNRWICNRSACAFYRTFQQGVSRNLRVLIVGEGGCHGKGFTTSWMQVYPQPCAVALFTITSRLNRMIGEILRSALKRDEPRVRSSIPAGSNKGCRIPRCYFKDEVETRYRHAFTFVESVCAFSVNSRIQVYCLTPFPSCLFFEPGKQLRTISL